MGAYAGPDVSESGLVLALDGANYKSFKGEPTTNLITDPLALSGLPSPFTYNAHEATAERTDQLPNSEMKKISPYWIKLVKTSSSNGRAIVYAQNGYTTGVDYCRSFYVYSEDTNLTQVKWISENTGVETIQSYTQYNPSDLGQIKRIQTILRSVGGSTLDALRFGTSDPIGTTIWVTGIQIEQKSYPTTVVNGTRGDTVATGGGWADMSGNGNHGQLVNGVRESSDSLGALVFDGTNDRANSISNISFGNNASWEAWINRTSSVNSYNMFMGRYLPYFGARSGSTGFHFSNNISGQKNVYTTGITVQNNTWYCVAFTTEYNGSNTTMKIYVNGEFNNSGTFAGSQGEYAQGFSIGDGRDYASWYPFNGKVSNVKVYNRTLTAAEIQQNFNATRGRFGI